MKNSVIKFCITGGSATLIDYCIYMLLSGLIYPNIAKTISMLVAAVYSFFINKKWTFQNKERMNLTIIFKFAVCQMINIFVNVNVNAVFLKLTEIKTVAFIIATGMAMVVNYLIQRIVVFHYSATQ